jgi:hypothetical protein
VSLSSGWIATARFAHLAMTDRFENTLRRLLPRSSWDRLPAA